MATFFLDPVNGNDSNDGTTFANRWKTLTSGATAARIAPGDTIRVIKSPDATSMSINATFTNKSATITLASALTQDVDTCETAFTAATNVTATADTSVYRQGSKSCKLVTNGSFTTGQMAWRATGALDLSGYQQISFWIRNETTALAAGDLQIKLFTGSDGATGLVHTISVPAIPSTAKWVPVVVDLGGAMNAGVNSIGIHAVATETSKTFYVDNVIACKASSGGDSLNLTSLIGKSTAGTAPEAWWPIRSISGTTVIIDASPNMTVTDTARGYAGTTSTETAYKRETLKVPMQSSSLATSNAWQDSGSAGNLIQLLGGWDTSAMTTQTGESWYDGQNGLGAGMTTGSSQTLWNVDKINFVRYEQGANVGSGSAWTIGSMQIVGCNNNPLQPGGLTSATTIMLSAGWMSFGQAINGGLGNGCTITNLVVLSFGTSSGFTGVGWVLSGGNQVAITNLTIRNCSQIGLSLASAGCPQWSITTLTLADNNGIQLSYATTSACDDWYIGTLSITNGTTDGFATTQPCRNWIINSATITGNGGWGMNLSANGQITIRSLTTSTNTSGAIQAGNMNGHVFILASSMAEATKVSISGASVQNYAVILRNYNGTSGDHRSYYVRSGTVFSESSVRHTASGISWKFSPLNVTYITAQFPLKKVVARVTVAASALVTVSAWVRRDSLSITSKLVCPGGQIGGVPSDVVATSSAAINTWEQLTLTFTPTETGTVEIEYQAYGGTTLNTYIDDLAISQV